KSEPSCEPTPHQLARSSASVRRSPRVSALRKREVRFAAERPWRRWQRIEAGYLPQLPPPLQNCCGVSRIWKLRRIGCYDSGKGANAMNNIYSLGNAAALIQIMPTEIRKAAEALNIKPSVFINGIPHFEESDLQRIA